MNDESSQIFITRVFDAPRELVYQAFTEPDHLAAWWGPLGNSLPRSEMLFDVRPGGYLRWTEVVAHDPDARIHVYVDLTGVAPHEMLEGTMHVSGQRSDGFEPFQTRIAVRFYDEAGGRTRLEISQWLPPHLVGPSEQGWQEAFTKLDTALSPTPAVTADQPGGSAWPS